MKDPSSLLGTGPSSPLGAGLNPRQREAVETTGRDLLVRAGAGTGKTRVLAHRFHHLVEREEVPIDQILAITFTEKAAAEMRSRVAALFQSAEMREQIEFAPISTIHAFCARLIREEAIDGGVDPNFTVVEEVEARDLLDQAFEETSRRWIRDRRPDLDALLAIHADAAHLQGEILDIYDKVRSTPISFEDLHLARLDVDVDELLDRIAAIRLEMEVATRSLKPDRAEILRPLLTALTGLAASVKSLPPIEAAGKIGEIVRGINLGRFRKPPIKPLLKELRDTCLEKLRGVVLDEVAAEHFGGVRDFLVDLDSAYTALKRVGSHLDFSDLEREALALLGRHREEGRRPHRSYRHILVDEYQDTNPIQEAIIEAIRGGAERFAVGDPGQSIYRFRGAELGALVDYEREVGERGTILLDRTYRPSPALLAFQNAFFEKLFEEGPIRFAPMEPGAEFVPRENPAVEILTATGDDSRSARDAEAAMIARRVEEIVKGKSLRFTRKDPDRPDLVGKPIAEGDIAILLRSATHLAVYERALGARGIRSFAGIGGGFYSSLEVMDLENLLRVIVRPDDRTALAAFFASPFVGMTDQDLLRFLACWTGAPAGTPWQEAVQAEGLPPDLVEKVRRAHGVVRSLREVEGVGGLLDLVERMIRVGRYDLVTLLQQGGTRRLANLRKLEGIARRLDRDGGHGARDFLRMIEDLRDRDSREAEAAVGSEAEEVVRIMTVHGAKGLEFPVVILANLAARPRLETAPIRSDRRGGIAFKIHGDEPRRSLEPGGYAALAQAESIAATAEERRLLYVAMTRVQEHLILSCGISPRRASWSEWLKDVLRICDIADPTEAGRHSLGEGTFDVLTTEGIEQPALRGLEGTAPRRLEGTAPAEKVPTEGVLEAVQAGRGIGPLPEADLVKARASWERVSKPGGALDVVPFIASTSELIRFDACPLAYFWSGLVGVWEGHRSPPEQSVPFARPGEDEVLDREDRRRMGTAVHAILETCSLDRGPSEEDVRRILQEELGRAATAEAVDRAKALASSFLESDWGRKARDLHREDSSRVIRERPFLLRHEGLLVKGTVDLILLPSGESAVVIDYKSGSAARTNGSRAGYALQMQIYSLALDKILGVPTAAILFYLQDGVAVEVAPGEEVVTDLFRRFREAHESTAPGKGPEPHFPARPSVNRCRACEFRDVCPAAQI